MSLDFTNVTSVTIPEGDVTQIAIGGSTVWKRQPPAGYWEVTRSDGIAPAAGTMWVVRLSDGSTGYYDFTASAFTAVSFAVGDVVGHDDIMFSVDVAIQTGHMSQYVYINGTNHIIIWGDGYCSTTSGSHTYSTPGNYTIKIYSFRPTAMRFYSAAYTDNRVCKINNNIPWSTIQNVDWAFHNTNIVSIPASLFSACTSLESLQETFSGCHYLNEIPGTLFTGCVNIKWLNACFANCWSINNIPNNLFNGLVNVKDFYGCFYMTTHITSIPENLFSETTSAENFKWTFYGTPITSIPDTLFNQCNSANNFTECFKNCTSVIGAVPNLWESHPNATGTGCFAGCTQATNYADAQQAGWA